ncbi:XdhC family protein [Crenothrix sp.]|uniref:XdhC family protein n=1 Tax=Crenothrix sp. TaxID=3100433 RepID=UPI00374D9501
MNESQAIIEAFDKAQAQGERCALVTVVNVEGSAYRHPGARMLVTESSQSTGMISAGCLETDVIQQALRVIDTQLTELIEYDTTSTTQEMAWGLGLGCHGVVSLLIEPCTLQCSYINALRLTFTAASNTAAIAVATVFHYSPADLMPVADIKIGARVIINKFQEINCTVFNNRLATLIYQDADSALLEEKSGACVYNWDGNSAKVFIEIIPPPITLVIFGAGYDVLPIVKLASGLGWQTDVIDVQARPASLDIFSLASKVTLARPENVHEHVRITLRSFALLMTHNYVHDKSLLEFLLLSTSRYIGVMGPKKRTERLLDDVEKTGGFTCKDTDLARIYAPVGLDIGAGSPEEIALSIIAEIRALVADRHGGHLCTYPATADSKRSVKAWTSSKVFAQTYAQ